MSKRTYHTHVLNLSIKMEDTEWTSFPEIPPFLLNNLIENDYPAPFPVQIEVIEKFFLSDTDLAIGFPTGSGKTLAYLIPIICALHNRIVQRLRAVIVVPNRELAIQVFNVCACLIQGSKLTVSVLSTNYYAGEPSSDTNVTDICICSSLGLSSYLVEKDEKLLRDVEYIVLDEGDAILEQPLENWLDHVNNSLHYNEMPTKFSIPLSAVPPRGRRIRKILCSATLARNSKQSEEFEMQCPQFLITSDKSRYVIPPGLEEQFILAQKPHKAAILQSLTNQYQYILCFVSTSKRVVALANIMRKLLPDLNVVEFAASAGVEKKRSALESADPSGQRLIIATDSLARGINLPFIDAVVNFDSPTSARTYIHRIGRTARGGQKGTCITLLLDSELLLFRDIISKIDGSKPEEVNVNLRGLTGRFYVEATKGFDNLKVRKAPEKRMRKTTDQLDEIDIGDDNEDAEIGEFNEEEQGEEPQNEEGEEEE